MTPCSLIDGHHMEDNSAFHKTLLLQVRIFMFEKNVLVLETVFVIISLKMIYYVYRSVCETYLKHRNAVF
jgi:hypothetical protein